ncbi:MAG: hypothetical protein JNL74_24420 [Fibrobacteres bacterium]|nr:hypothetical protein [Fibrobacterota bacterium]
MREFIDKVISLYNSETTGLARAPFYFINKEGDVAGVCVSQMIDQKCLWESETFGETFHHNVGLEAKDRKSIAVVKVSYKEDGDIDEEPDYRVWFTCVDLAVKNSTLTVMGEHYNVGNDAFFKNLRELSATEYKDEYIECIWSGFNRTYEW